MRNATFFYLLSCSLFCDMFWYCAGSASDSDGSDGEKGAPKQQLEKQVSSSKVAKLVAATTTAGAAAGGLLGIGSWMDRC